VGGGKYAKIRGLCVFTNDGWFFASASASKLIQASTRRCSKCYGSWLSVTLTSVVVVFLLLIVVSFWQCEMRVESKSWRKEELEKRE
jgi:uncharacterized membrane protein